MDGARGPAPRHHGTRSSQCYRTPFPKGGPASSLGLTTAEAPAGFSFGEGQPVHTESPLWAVGRLCLAARVATWGLNVSRLAAHTSHFPLALVRVANGEVLNEDLITPSANGRCARAMGPPGPLISLTRLSEGLFVVSSMIISDL